MKKPILFSLGIVLLLVWFCVDKLSFRHSPRPVPTTQKAAPGIPAKSVSTASAQVQSKPGINSPTTAAKALTATTVATEPLDAFGQWADGYLKARPAERAAMTVEGIA